MRFIVLCLFVVLVVATTSCSAIEHHRKSLKDEISHEIHQQKLIESAEGSINNHHYIPRQDYGNGGGTPTDSSVENHHYLPRQDFNNGGSTGDDSNNETKS